MSWMNKCLASFGHTSFRVIGSHSNVAGWECSNLNQQTLSLMLIVFQLHKHRAAVVSSGVCWWISRHSSRSSLFVSTAWYHLSFSHSTGHLTVGAVYPTSYHVSFILWLLTQHRVRSQYFGTCVRPQLAYSPVCDRSGSHSTSGWTKQLCLRYSFLSYLLTSLLHGAESFLSS